MEDGFIYSVKELCDIFEINNNSFPSIARRLNINTSEYCKMKETYYKSKKRYYNKLAYKKLEEYILEKNKKTNYWSRKTAVYKYLKRIEELNKIIDEMAKEINNTTDNSYCNSDKECSEEECINCIKRHFKNKVEKNIMIKDIMSFAEFTKIKYERKENLRNEKSR